MLNARLSSRAFRPLVAAASLFAGLWSTSVLASPVLLAGTGSEKVHSTDITVTQKDGKSVITVMPDYQGPLSSFAVILPVPKDVTNARVNTLKREFVDRLSLVSAPKFAEFWEMDPCSDEKFEQDWERDMTASADTGFLGTMKTDPAKKVAKEMLLDVEAKMKDGEYKETLIGSADEIKAWLGKKQYSLPEGGEQNLAEFEAAGYKFLVLDVDTNRMELMGGDRAILSPIRFWTEEPLKSLPTKFGLPSAAKQQELTIFTLVPETRMQVTNYETKAVPTNLRVQTDYVESADKKYNLKEKMGEFYVALHDRFLEKNPQTFLMEYAWSSSECAQPCATEPLLPHELLSLGGDVFEADLPEEVRRPKPPEPTDEEKAKLEEVLAMKETAKEKKAAKEMWEADREELVARKGILERNQFVLTRLHYRYDAKQMPKNVELGAGAPITGGIALPEGPEGAADTSVKPSDKNQFQSRYNGLFPNQIVVKCENPKPHRWGKAPRSYRGLRKIWVAEDLARRNRTRIDVTQAVLSQVPELGLTGVATEKPADVAVPAAAAEEKKDGDCGCRSAGLPVRSGWAGLASAGLALLFWRRRRANVQA